MPLQISETQLARDLSDMTPGDAWNARRDIIAALHDAPGAYATVLAKTRMNLGYPVWTAKTQADRAAYPSWRDRVHAYQSQGLI